MTEKFLQDSSGEIEEPKELQIAKLKEGFLSFEAKLAGMLLDLPEEDNRRVSLEIYKGMTERALEGLKKIGEERNPDLDEFKGILKQINDLAFPSPKKPTDPKINKAEKETTEPIEIKKTKKDALPKAKGLRRITPKFR
jgi:hypothetical protein